MLNILLVPTPTTATPFYLLNTHNHEDTKNTIHNPKRMNIDAGLWLDHEAQIVFSHAKYTNILHSNLHTINHSYAKTFRRVTQFLTMK